MSVEKKEIGNCHRCGFMVYNTNQKLHRDTCDKILPGKELGKFVAMYPAFPMMEFDYYFSVHIGRTREFLIRSGWTKEEIRERNLFSKSQLKIIDENISGLGTRSIRNRYKARCLRCEILLFAENIPLRFCRYCVKENEYPEFHNQRLSMLSSFVEADCREVRQGFLSFGWDGTMRTYFAFVVPPKGRNIPLWSVGNSPKQIITLAKFERVLEAMGVVEYDEVIKRARKFKKPFSKPFSERMLRYVTSSDRKDRDNEVSKGKTNED